MPVGPGAPDRVNPCGAPGAGKAQAAKLADSSSMAGALSAIRDLSTTVSKFVEAASEKEERTSSAIKWERKRPTIKADDAESLMSEST